MASNKIEVSVSVEASIHKWMCDMAQRVFDEFGVQVHSAIFEWVDVGTVGEQKYSVAAVQMDTKMMARGAAFQKP